MKNNLLDKSVKMFQFFDIDGNGSLDIGELKRVFNNWGADVTNEDIEQLMDTADVDKDKKVTYEEFKKLMELVDFNIIPTDE